MDELEIEATARQWLLTANAVLGVDYFNMVQFIRDVLQPELKNRDKLQINVVAKNAMSAPAKVTFSPLTLHVNSSTWLNAEVFNSPFERYVLAHECGHIILHDGYAKAFSSDPNSRVSSVDRYRSAEWQADRFADFLLMPTPVAELYSNAQQLAIRAAVPEEMARERIAQVDLLWKTAGIPHGLDYCPQCYSSDSMRIGSRTRCKVCGHVVQLEL